MFLHRQLAVRTSKAPTLAQLHADDHRYWNWELDSTDVTKAPIWDSESGFGSDGESSMSQGAILNGYCVNDGPFQNLEIPYLDEKYYPHCLSRGFLSGDDLLEQSENLSTHKIEEVLSLNDYNEFNLGLENGPHLAIPRSIRGDFSLLTAPSGKRLGKVIRDTTLINCVDPVFFLHHTQLDRIWWRWQASRPARKFEYAGAASHGSEKPATTSDELDMGGLARMIPVSAVLDAANGMLCYTY
jgi:tyrosinase